MLHPINKNNPDHILKEVFGFESFRSIQKKIINEVMQGKDNFVLMPTGGGKSLCYQVPALALEGMAIVVSPLISLMQDQVQSLQANGVSAYYLNSSLSQEESQRIFAKLMASEIKLLYLAPERLLNKSFLEYIKNLKLSLIAIDEAHCVSQWGPDFRPEYQQLSILKEIFAGVPTIALTATADKVTRKDIIQQLHLNDAVENIASFDRKNIRYHVVEKHNPTAQLKPFLKRYENESGIVYCLSRKRVEALSEKLREMGFNAAAYHAGMDSKERQKIQNEFQKEELNIIVATVAFGMGIDKSNVRFVIHYDIPKSIEHYYQETGRAGRDGLPAEVLLLFSLQGVAQVKSLLENTQDENLKRIEQHKFNAMIQFAEAQSCRRQVLLNYFNEEYTHNCNNCDVCLSPPETYDATVDAQKALSCIYRLQQKFGANHVIEVLRGLSNQKIKSWGHDKLSTYGIGKEYSQQEWFSIIRQLIHQGIIEQDIANFSVLKLTNKAAPILRGQQALILAKPKQKQANKPMMKEKFSKSKLLNDENYDSELFEALRLLRKKLAAENNVAPFIIFSDAALIDMVVKRPQTANDFLAVNGVGQKKLSSYGDHFMACIKDYLAKEA